jgi:two-component system response regulator CpxR
MKKSHESYRLLLVDDDGKFCLLMKEYLVRNGFQVTCVYEGLSAIRAATNGQWDGIILDVLLPGADGYQVLRCVREKSDIPVILISALGDEESERIVGLELGADDYVSKTASPRELLARIRAVLRRDQRLIRQRNLIVGGIAMDLLTRAVTLDGKRIALTPVEFELLQTFVRAKGKIVTREQLTKSLLERHPEIGQWSLNVHISSLRRKLNDDLRRPRFIKTIRAVGYLMMEN